MGANPLRDTSRSWTSELARLGADIGFVCSRVVSMGLNQVLSTCHSTQQRSDYRCQFGLCSSSGRNKARRPFLVRASALFLGILTLYISICRRTSARLTLQYDPPPTVFPNHEIVTTTVVDVSDWASNVGNLVTSFLTTQPIGSRTPRRCMMCQPIRNAL